MRAFVYTRPGLEVREMKEPQIIAGDDIKVKIEYCSICGSDTHLVAGEWDNTLAKESGPFGHEAAGRIVAMGESCRKKGLKIGDKAAIYHKTYCNKCFFCRNGQEHLCSNRITNAFMFAEYIVVNEQAVHKLPDTVDTLKGAMTEPVSVCLHAVDLLNVKPGNNAVIFGGGGLGLLALKLLNLAGAAEITVIEPIAEKRELALRLGAAHVLNPMEERFLEKALALTEGRGFQKAMEMSGSTAAAEQILKVVSRGGEIVYFSNYTPNFKIPVDADSFVNREISMRGVFQSPYMFPRVMSILPVMDINFLTEHIYPLENALEAWEAHMSKKYPKIVIQIAKEIE